MIGAFHPSSYGQQLIVAKAIPCVAVACVSELGPSIIRGKVVALSSWLSAEIISKPSPKGGTLKPKPITQSSNWGTACCLVPAWCPLVRSAEDNSTNLCRHRLGQIRELAPEMLELAQRFPTNAGDEQTRGSWWFDVGMMVGYKGWWLLRRDDGY